MVAIAKLSPVRLAAVALLSGGGLFLEVTLTRLFSTVFYPPYVFAVLSLAVLGIGIGAALAAGIPALRNKTRLPLYLGLAGLAAVILLLVTLLTPVVRAPGPLLLLVIGPFLFLGLALAAVFSATPGRSPRLYLADLMGAGLGALLTVPALNVLGAVDGVLLAAALFGFSGTLISLDPSLAGASLSRTMRPPLALAMGVLALLAINLIQPVLALDVTQLAPDKALVGKVRAGGDLLATRWDAFARTDLIRPAMDGPWEIYMDGTAGSVMPPAGDNPALRQDIGFFPFATGRPDRVFVIGPGAGLDVWFALQAGAEQIDGVEINPASVEMVYRYGEYNGHLYAQPGVNIVVDEGRSALRRTPGTYDLIFLSQVVTLAAERTGYALTENTIYTVEAFRDYLDHLSPDGQIALKLYDELTLTRALITALTALQEQGLSDQAALHHVAAFVDPGSQPPVPLLLVSKRPFRQEESLALGAVAQDVGFRPLFLPGVLHDPPLADVMSGQAGIADIVARFGADISAPRDDRPFFFQFEPGLPRSLVPVLVGLVGLMGAGGIVLIAMGRQIRRPVLRWAPLYFAGLGFGFMTVEIALIQQTRLFLGHPTPAITAVLAILLIAGGLGSGLGGRWFPRSGGIPAVPAVAVAVLVLIWAALWPFVSEQALATAYGIRLGVVMIGLAPLGLLMGMPFPLGLRTVGEGGDRHVAVGWAVNGIMSVVGSAGAVALAITSGFNTVLFAGAAAYGLAALVAHLTRKG